MVTIRSSRPKHLPQNWRQQPCLAPSNLSIYILGFAIQVERKPQKIITIVKIEDALMTFIWVLLCKCNQFFCLLFHQLWVIYLPSSVSSIVETLVEACPSIYYPWSALVHFLYFLLDSSYILFFYFLVSFFPWTQELSFMPPLSFQHHTSIQQQQLELSLLQLLVRVINKGLKSSKGFLVMDSSSEKKHCCGSALYPGWR